MTRMVLGDASTRYVQESITGSLPGDVTLQRRTSHEVLMTSTGDPSPDHGSIQPSTHATGCAQTFPGPLPTHTAAAARQRQGAAMRRPPSLLPTWCLPIQQNQLSQVNTHPHTPCKYAYLHPTT